MAPLAAQAAETADLASKQSAAGIGIPGSALESIADTAGGGAIAGSLLGDAYGVRLAVDGAGTVERSVAVPKGKVFSLTDILFQNPAGDLGVLQLQRDDEVLLRNNLANFRDLDFHFLSPIVFDEGRHAVLHVECAAPAPAHCTPAAYLAGKLKDKGTGATTSTTLEVSRSGRRSRPG